MFVEICWAVQRVLGTGSELDREGALVGAGTSRRNDGLRSTESGIWRVRASRSTHHDGSGWDVAWWCVWRADRRLRHGAVGDVDDTRDRTLAPGTGKTGVALLVLRVDRGYRGWYGVLYRYSRSEGRASRISTFNGYCTRRVRWYQALYREWRNARGLHVVAWRTLGASCSRCSTHEVDR